MASTTYKGRIRKDGALLVPKAARQKLGLRQGDEVEVILKKPAESETVTTAPATTSSPLDAIIGLGAGRSDGAAKHDRYLYGKDPE